MPPDTTGSRKRAAKEKTVRVSSAPSQKGRLHLCIKIPELDSLVQPVLIMENYVFVTIA